jgi:hypothetical protein
MRKSPCLVETRITLIAFSIAIGACFGIGEDIVVLPDVEALFSRRYWSKLLAIVDR